VNLYHGGIQTVESPRIIRNEIGRDFGFAFYTTDIREQAERWAWRRCRAARRNGLLSAHAVVSVFQFDDLLARQHLRFRDFSCVSMDWLDMVVACRSNPNHVHGFDLVTGKIANDNVGETIAYVVAGVMRKEDALERLRFQQINNQFAFCTEKALSYLTFETSCTVEKQP
jgi:hypothetical protein